MFRKIIKYCIILGILFISKTSCTNKSDFELKRLVQPLSSKGDLFGWSCSISGNYCFVGALDKSFDSIKKAGACYIYNKQNSKWKYKQILWSPTPQECSYFGRSVSVSGPYAVIGAYGQKHCYDTITKRRTGSAFIYKCEDGEWKFYQEINLLNSDYINSNFGVQVSISEDNLAISAQNPAEVYMYKLKNNSWNFIQKIKNKCPFFGYTISCRKNRLVIGSGGVCGEIYVYKYQNNEWLLTDGVYSQNKSETFGTSVEINDNFLFVGEEEGINDQTSFATGCVHIYKIGMDDRCTFFMKLTPGRDNMKTGFGSRMSVDSNYLAVGAFAEPLNKLKSSIKDDSILNETNAGAVYVYKLTKQSNWVLLGKIISPNPKPWDKFGFSLQISGNNIIIGARLEDNDKKEDSGGAYMFSMKN